MRFSLLFALVLITAVPVLAQVEPDATGEPAGESLDQTKMMLPPPVSGQVYPGVVGAEERTNILLGGLTFETGYDDNVYPGILPKPISDTTFTVLPSINFNRTTPKQKQIFSYSPGFTIYQHTSQLNAIDQNAGLNYTYRFSPYTAFNLSDAFLQTSNLLGQPGGLSGGGVNGTSGVGAQPIIFPYAEELSNTVRGSFDKQYARNQMFGFAGAFNLLNYPNQKQAPGLYDSKTASASAFFAQRFSVNNYVGASYDYEHVAAYPPNASSTAETHSFMPYFTFFFDRTTSLSVSAGPQHYSVAETGLQNMSGWTPAVSASLGWQALHTNFSAGYARTVTAGGGLLGAFLGNSGDLSARWQPARAWVVGVGFDYAAISSLTPAFTIGFPTGHRIDGTALCRRAFGEHFGLEVGYDRLHQSYTNLALLAGVPDSDRGYVSLSYTFRKSLGQ